MGKLTRTGAHTAEWITMFDDIHGLGPEEAARWTSLAEQSLDLLAVGADMEAVQRFLLDRGAGVIEAIAITRELIGGGPRSLVKAKEIVLMSKARFTQLNEHEQLSRAKGSRVGRGVDGIDAGRLGWGARPVT